MTKFTSCRTFMKGYYLPLVTLLFNMSKLIEGKFDIMLCISTSKCMLALTFAWSKTTKNIRNAHEMHTRGLRRKTFFIIFKFFLSFSTMRTHEQENICWSKYTITEY